jgi:signal transduction histidine kinase
MEETILKLQQEIEQLKKLNEELEKASKLLVRKDLELSRANERLQQLDRAKSDFISVAAHQLRTPLSATKWIFSLLLEGDAGPLTEDQRTLVRKGYNSNERMIALINDLLTVSRIEEGKLRYELMPLQAENLIESVLMDFEGLQKERNVSIVFKRMPQPTAKISVDPEKMRAVFQNLIDNAVKYTPSGKQVTVTVLQKNPEEVEISVKDSGIGISVADQGRIFSRFFRGKNAMKLETDGSGLGLFIVKSIVMKHGGRIWFESKENEGTTFYVALPAVA